LIFYLNYTIFPAVWQPVGEKIPPFALMGERRGLRR